jgi:DNA-binding NarL/FixJ family response regulator
VPGIDDVLAGCEIEVPEFVAGGLTNMEIANVSCIGFNSAKQDVKHIYRKSGISSNISDDELQHHQRGRGGPAGRR